MSPSGRSSIVKGATASLFIVIATTGALLKWSGGPVMYLLIGAVATCMLLGASLRIPTGVALALIVAEVPPLLRGDEVVATALGNALFLSLCCAVVVGVWQQAVEERGWKLPLREAFRRVLARSVSGQLEGIAIVAGVAAVGAMLGVAGQSDLALGILLGLASASLIGGVAPVAVGALAVTLLLAAALVHQVNPELSTVVLTLAIAALVASGVTLGWRVLRSPFEGKQQHPDGPTPDQTLSPQTAGED